MWTAGFELRPPVDPPVRITQHFGQNLTGIPDFYSRYGLPGHEGIDFGGKHGDPIYAADDGIVEAILIPGQNGIAADHPYGKHVKLVHKRAGQTWRTQYCHLSGVVLWLAVGQQVPGDAQIGYMGNTGNVVKNTLSDGTHLHFMLRKAGATARGETNFPNDLVDPEPYFRF